MKRLIMVCAFIMPHSMPDISQEYLDEGTKRLNLSQLEYIMLFNSFFILSDNLIASY